MKKDSADSEVDAVDPKKLSRESMKKAKPTNQEGKRESPTALALHVGRRILWQGNPRLAFILQPFRVYMLDPCLALNAALLPMFLPTWVDPICARTFEHTGLPLLRCLYGRSIGGPAESTARSTARSAILIQPHQKTMRRPTDIQSAFNGAVGFAVSTVKDVAGLLTNPKKLTGWMKALSQFQTFLETTGVDAELYEAIQKPLLGGRLLDNLKILNDVQEVRAKKDRITDCASTDKTNHKKDDLSRGHKYMRFATAAYGTEMIQSAVDKEMDAFELMEDQRSAIALHTGLSEKDIHFIYHEASAKKRDKAFDAHVLHHFIAFDHADESVILAIRGTLSLSGAIIDIQGMAADFCHGKAHKGISQMAGNLWNESGDRLREAMKEYSGYKLIVTGHSLGAGTSCLLTVQLHVEDIFPGRIVECFAFAPPPTFCMPQGTTTIHERIRNATKNTVAFVHDNDVVPFLSLSAVRRMASLLDAVDNETEHIWFWNRWRIFYEYLPIPKSLVKSVLDAEKKSSVLIPSVDGEFPMSIPARRVIWMKHTPDTATNGGGRFQAHDCDPAKVAAANIFLCPDMLTDHLPEQYEDALDDLILVVK